jgi:hypothetical protein
MSSSPSPSSAAAALDPKHLDFLAGDVARARLDRGVAAAVQYQAGHAAEQARGVDPQCQVLLHALLVVARHRAFRIPVVPE